MCGLERDIILNVQETSLLLRSRRTTTLVLAIILGISLLVFRQTLASALYQNLGYIHLTRDLLSPASNRAELASAQGRFAAALGWQENNSRARWGLGQAYQQLGEDATAVGEWRLGEGALSRLLTMSDAAFKEEEYGEALAQALLAVQVDPNSSSAHYRVGEASRAVGELDQALAQYERAKELNSFLPRDEADMASCYFGAGRVYEAQEKWNTAVWHYEAGSELRSDAAAYAALGNIYHYQLRDLSTAEEYLQQAIALEPAQAWSHVSLAGIYLEQERYAHAVSELETGIELGDWGIEAAQLHIYLGRAYYGLGQFENAVQAYQNALALDSDNGSAQQGLEKALERLPSE